MLFLLNFPISVEFTTRNPTVILMLVLTKSNLLLNQPKNICFLQGKTWTLWKAYQWLDFHFQSPIYNCWIEEKDKREEAKWWLGRQQRPPTLHELHTFKRKKQYLVKLRNTSCSVEISSKCLKWYYDSDKILYCLFIVNLLSRISPNVWIYRMIHWAEQVKRRRHVMYLVYCLLRRVVMSMMGQNLKIIVYRIKD